MARMYYEKDADKNLILNKKLNLVPSTTMGGFFLIHKNN